LFFNQAGTLFINVLKKERMEKRYLDKRIINVSNRLPVKIVFTDGAYSYQNSEGGLATGLSSVIKEHNNLWIGWPGSVVEESQKQTITNDLRLQNLYPVFLNESEIKKYYEGFSNETIWPLFHYFPNFSEYNPQYWETYFEVNKKFAAEIVKFATEDDIIWVHDYQLMLLPGMLRKLLPGITIGYFQHIPFPSYDIFRVLPWKSEILSGLLGADIVGFQTDDDVTHFINCAGRILNTTAKNNELIVAKRIVVAQAFPISIDYQKYRQLALHPITKKNALKLKKSVNTRIAISIDRLDYSKGIIQRLKAFELFLKQYPEWHEKVTLIHLVVPSRDNVLNYKELKEEMNRLITEINGKYATIGWQPIQHYYRSFAPNLLSALYIAADLALVTPLRDGMNLVCKEYIASNVCKNGMLVLSEAAGAARELTEALPVNPNDIEDFANKIYAGLNMPAFERSVRMTIMQETVQKADIFNWMNTFMTKLNEIKARQSIALCCPVDPDVLQKIDLQYCYAAKRLFLLDYDGTLVPFNKRIDAAVPDIELLHLLENLAADEHNKVVIISGRDNVTLGKWLGHLPVDIIAEHGAWFKERGRKWYCAPGLSTAWKRNILKSFNAYAANTPGAFIEEKAFSIAWHYRAADNKLGYSRAIELANSLRGMTESHDLDVLHGDKVIEVKCSNINKGKAAQKYLDKESYDFVLAIGDDTSDEDMFKVLPEGTITIKVGSDISAATYCQKSCVEVRELLKEIHEASVILSDNANLQLAG
jgi:trehalose 6-phosphate synthase/phosphatase